MPRWLIIVIAVFAAMVILPFVLFGIGDEEPDEEPAPAAARVIDELRGTYRGVGIGDSAAKVRSVFGARKDAGAGPFWPLAATGFGDVGGPTLIRYPGMPLTPRTAVLLRYQHVAFLLLDDQVFALMLTEEDAATVEGVAIGHHLDAAEERYERLNCDEAEVGDFGETFPYCAGVVAPRRHIWFGQDPIRSITIASTSFGNAELSREERCARLRRRVPDPPPLCW